MGRFACQSHCALLSDCALGYSRVFHFITTIGLDVHPPSLCVWSNEWTARGIQLKLSAFFEWRHTHSAVAFDRKIVQLAHVEPLILIDGRIMKAEVGGWGPPTDLVGHQSRRQFAVAPQFDYKSCADGASLSLTDSFSDGQSPEMSVSGRIPAEHPAGLGKIGCS